MVTSKDFYSILGVPEKANLQEIKKAYRNLALKYHPDRAAAADKKKSEEKFKEISEAYYVLSDEKRRAEYDNFKNGPAAYSADDFASAQGFDFQEILKHFRSSGASAKRTRARSGYEDIFDVFEHMNSSGANQYVFTSDPRQQSNGAEEETDINARINVPQEVMAKGGEAKFKLSGKEVTLTIKAGTKHGQKLRLRGQGKTCSCCRHAGDLILTII